MYLGWRTYVVRLAGDPVLEVVLAALGRRPLPGTEGLLVKPYPKVFPTCDLLPHKVRFAACSDARHTGADGAACRLAPREALPALRDDGVFARRAWIDNPCGGIDGSE